jgi:hypothetical protein
MMYPIEKDIPIPDWPPGHKPVSPIYSSKLYPFHLMEIGDSFLVPPKSGETMRTVCRRVMPRVVRESREEKKFISRRCKDGLRVWRVA